jgi:hypothetical protein
MTTLARQIMMIVGSTKRVLASVMDDPEQQRIEKRLRERLAKPRYPAIFYLPAAYWVHVPGPFDVAAEEQERCPSVARAETVYGGVHGGAGVVERRKVRCEMPLGNNGSHSLAAIRRPLSHYWEARQWRKDPRDSSSSPGDGVAA